MTTLTAESAYSRRMHGAQDMDVATLEDLEAILSLVDRVSTEVLGIVYEWAQGWYPLFPGQDGTAAQWVVRVMTDDANNLHERVPVNDSNTD